MTENPYAGYLKYVRDVLGANQFVADSVDSGLKDHFYQPDEKLDIEKPWDLLFVNSIFTSMESLFEKEQHDLLQKMVAAMKLKNESVLAVDTHITSEREILRRWTPYGAPKVMVLFKQNPEITNELRYVDDTSVIETYSPYHLLHHPEFKKITWNHLQLVMGYFNKN
jgi:hypothetical protein